MNKKSYLLKLGCGLLILLLLLSFSIKVQDLVSEIRYSIPFWLFLAALMHLSGLIISAIRWKILLSACSIKASILDLSRSYLIGGFVGWFLPTRIGADIYRMADRKQQCGSMERSFTVICVEGLISMYSLLIIGIAAVLIYSNSNGQDSQKNILAMLCLILFVVSLFVLVLLSSKRFLSRLKKSSDSLRKGKLKRGLIKAITIHELLRQFWKTKGSLIAAFLLSLTLQLNLILYFYFIVRALEINVSFVDLCMIMPLIISIQLLHLTPNGIGVREVTAVLLFGYFLKIPNSQALAISLWDYVLTFIYVFVGAILFLLKREHAPSMRVASELQIQESYSKALNEIY